VRAAGLVGLTHSMWLRHVLYVNLGSPSFRDGGAPVMVETDMGRLWWRRTPHPAAAGSPAWRGTAVYGAVAALLGAGILHYIPGPPPGPAVPAPAGHVRTVAVFHRIVMPDLAVIERSGVSAADLARIAKVSGVRQVLPLDGASVTMDGHPVNVIGVNAQLYRSWTPLDTASNQQLWNSLASGGFVASRSAQRRLHLHVGARYSVTGLATLSLPFAGAAPLGIRGIDLVVAARVAARLGLVHNVAALISAPGTGVTQLKRDIRVAMRHHAKLVTLRAQSAAATPISATSDKRPVTYFQLFQESAAKYCPGLPWTVLAAIGQIESGDGANTGPSSAGALGPMQFMPATWKVWGISTPWQPGPPNIMSPFDAVPAAARYLCAAGGATAAGLPKAVFAYNHANWYVAEVLALAKAYARG
jgi:Transglycosylase SLT domain